MKSVSLGGRRVGVPFFAATVSADDRLWPWKRDIHPDALLISYDVLLAGSRWAPIPVNQSLGFGGLIIVDSGGYGRSTETDAGAVYQLQRKVRANVGVILDKAPSASDSRKVQQITLQTTLRN